MPVRHSIFSYAFAFLTILILAGCATTPDQQLADGTSSYQFKPIPVPIIGEQDLMPAANAGRLLEQAQSAFDAANRAQEAGDKETAYAEYNTMMELLLESDLDPSVFYTLREEFSRILNETTKVARLYETTTPSLAIEEIGLLAVRSELEYPDPLNDRVLAEIRHIQQSYPKNFQAGLNRSARYLPYIRREFERAGLPNDLVWLAMVESQFTPRINSRVGAGGMWQFMPSTGKRFGLERDHFMDQRYDWKKSTQASIKYLSDLYDLFDSWPLAVSAYNRGEGGIERAIAMNGGQRDWWQLMETPPASSRIPRETKKFYAKLLASALIANDPERYGFSYAPEPEPVETTSMVKISGAYMISDLEKAAGMASGSLQKLNTQFLYGYTPPNRTTDLYVPMHKESAIRVALNSLPKLRPDTHVVRRGETMSEIAALYQVSAKVMMQANNISSPRKLQINQRLVIPGRMGSGAVTASSSGGRKVHTVRGGDSLSRIASQNRTSVKQLQAWNMMGSQTRIHIGDRLYVSASTGTNIGSLPAPTTKARPVGRPSTYVVKRGDYLNKIARNHGVKRKDLLSWNGLTAKSTIRVGDKIKIYGSQGNSVANDSKRATVTHTVVSGENPGVIAQAYGVRVSDLLRWNGLSKSSIVHVGDRLTIQSPGTRIIKGGEVVTSKEVTHVVRKGESASVIAQRYDVSLRDLYAWNNWKRDPVLQIGQKITVKQ
ncbi:MAG: LysM peptidoglycan-binding domain-containing protein [Candidatus Hydrogenedentota bacterium]